MSNDLIRYDLLVQDALRGVVRKVLGEVAKEGLPGDHHFYITFRTHAPGVRLSTAMREQYPDVMTIILQHQFWDLSVTEHNFEVGLSFRNVPERLLVPFDSVTEFYDPSVQFGLKFEVEEPAPEDGANDLEPGDMSDGPVVFAPAEARKDVNQEPHKEAVGDITPPDTQAQAGKVVSIDAFRKKN
jgi:uncharacterized protein